MKIERVFDVDAYFEVALAINGSYYLVIYGRHSNGGFCCVPNWSWGCEMGQPDDFTYNVGKLMGSGADEEVAKEIVRAIKFMSENKNK